jgi:hypothetical protein
MIRQPDQPGPRRPYAATANVTAVLNRIRTRNLPVAVNNDFLRIAGIGSAVFGRVTEALQFLRLIEEDGTPTELLRAMAAAPDADYRRLLADSLHGAYADDFRDVNPEHDTQQQIVEAFRRYEPRSQTLRMVMLFLGLCREAAIPVLDAPRDRQMRAPGRTTRSSGPIRVPTRQPTTGRTEPAPAGSPATGHLFSLTDDDVSKLSDQEFDEVWAALGKVARARARKMSAGDPETNAHQEVNPD